MADREKNENEIPGAEVEIEQPHDETLAGDGGKQEVPSGLLAQLAEILVGVSKLSEINKSFVIYLHCHTIAIEDIGEYLYRMRLDKAKIEETAEVTAHGTTWTMTEAGKVISQLETTPHDKKDNRRIAEMTAQNANAIPEFARFMEEAHATLLKDFTKKEAAKHRRTLKNRGYERGRDNPKQLARKTHIPDFEAALRFEMRLLDDFRKRFRYNSENKPSLEKFLYTRLKECYKNDP